MSIVERSKITSAYARAIALGASHSEACATVARALGLDVEIVDAVVTEQETTS